MRAVHEYEEEASEFLSALCLCHIEKVEQHSIRCSSQS
jgi:hypothetical protein